MESSTRRIEELDALIAALPDILNSPRIHVPIELPGSRGKRVARASVGRLLRQLAQLEASEETRDLPSVRRAREQYEARRERSPERLFAKIGAELKALADGYQFFVLGIEAEDRRCFKDYMLEVSVRLEAARLLERAGKHELLEPARQRLQGLDERLRPAFVPDDEPARTDGFPTDRDRHWWLYGAPRMADDPER